MATFNMLSQDEEVILEEAEAIVSQNDQLH